MARRRRCRRSRSKNELRLLYKKLAYLFLASSDDEDDEVVGVLFLLMAQRLDSATGLRGPYDRVKSVDFCQKLLYSYTEKWFKAHLRQACAYLTSITVLIYIYKPVECLDKAFGILPTLSRTT